MTTPPFPASPLPKTQMSEPICCPVQGPNPVDSEQLPGDDLLLDPLLETGWFIDADQKAEEAVAETEAQTNGEPELEKPAPPAAGTNSINSTAPAAAGAQEITPVSQRRPRRSAEEMAEQPDWLPEGWKIEVRVRVSGATAGFADRVISLFLSLNTINKSM